MHIVSVQTNIFPQVVPSKEENFRLNTNSREIVENCKTVNKVVSCYFHCQCFNFKCKQKVFPDKMLKNFKLLRMHSK